MKAQIENRPVFTTLTVNLEAGESFRAEAGAMVSMSTTVELVSKTAAKGIGGMFKAAVGGEGLFATEFTATGGAGEVVLAPPVPGDILEFNMSGKTVFAQSGAYLAGSNGLELGTKGSMKALLSGEGLFLQTISGTGTVWLSCYGAILVRELQAGETYTVDTGHMLAFEETVTYTVKKAAKGLFSTLASGEGLVARFQGPGKVWIQSRNLSGFASMLAKLMPAKK
jgi:uncharacterized protein (TIGR00266 family)